MNIKEYRKIFMSGIGGISMSGIAVILKKWNYEVYGSDVVKSGQTKFLEDNGIKVLIGQKAGNINNDIDLFIYTAAIKEDNPEYIRAKELGIKMVERGTFLGKLTKAFFLVSIIFPNIPIILAAPPDINKIIIFLSSMFLFIFFILNYIFY